MNAILSGLLPAAAAAVAGGLIFAPPPAGRSPAKVSTPDPQMKAVLDELASLNGKPIETLTPADRSGTTVGCTRSGPSRPASR